MSKITNSSTISSTYTMPDNTTKSYSATSNESTTEYMTDAFLKKRTSERASVVPSQEIGQTLTLTNNSEYEISDVFITDTIGNGATFKEGSLTVNGKAHPYDDPTVGFDLGTTIVANGGVVTVSYDIVVDTAPSNTAISTISSIRYTVNEVTLNERSNTIVLSVLNEKISITKTASVLAVVSGQTITFTNVVTNDGTIKNTDIMFYDPIPSGTTFVENSVKIDNVVMAGYDPETGFKIPDLDAGQSLTITFDVAVN